MHSLSEAVVSGVLLHLRPPRGCVFLTLGRTDGARQHPFWHSVNISLVKFSLLDTLYHEISMTKRAVKKGDRSVAQTDRTGANGPVSKIVSWATEGMFK